MKNITYSQYKREVVMQDHQPSSLPSDRSLMQSTPEEQYILIQKIEILSREIKGFEIRERLLKATNDSLTRALNGLKVSHDCRPLLENCHEQLKRIRDHKFANNVEVSREYYESLINQLKQAFEEEKQRMKEDFSKQIENMRGQVRRQLESQLKAESAELEERIRESQNHDKSKKQSKIKTQIKLGLGLVSPKYLNFDTIPKSTSRRKMEPVTALTLATNTESIKSTRNENMPRLANLQLVKSPPRDCIVSSSRLSRKSSRNDRRNSAVDMSFAGQKNVATDLLCDICNKSYSPNEFFNHVDNCKRNRYLRQLHRENASRKSIKRIIEINCPDDYDNDSENENENLEALQLLLKKKEDIQYRIQMLRCAKDGSQTQKERLETDLDNIVYFIKNRGNLKDQIKKIIQRKQVDNISIYKVRLDDNKSSARLSLGNNMFGKKTGLNSRRQTKTSRNIRRC